MTYSGKGANGDQLQIVTGNATWQPPTGGGGGVVTVAGAITADYATIVAAIAAGETIFNVIGDTTEPSNILVGSSGLNITLANSSTIDMGSNSVVWGSDSSVDMRGNGGISFNYSTSDVLFNVSSNLDAKLTVDGLLVTNSSTATAGLCNGKDMTFQACIFVGDAILDGVRNTIVVSDFRSNLLLLSNASGCQVSSCQIDGIIVDSGVATLLSDISTY